MVRCPLCGAEIDPGGRDSVAALLRIHNENVHPTNKEY